MQQHKHEQQIALKSQWLVLAKNMRRTRRLTAACAGLLVATLTTFACVAPAHAGASPWVSISLDRGHLLVDTEVAGVVGKSLIDTGANLNGINRRFVELHNLELKKGGKVKLAGVYDTSNRVMYDRVPVTLFGQQIKLNDLVELNIGAPDRQLLLGSNFLELFIFQFDYPNSRMRMLTRDSIDLKKLANVKTKRDRTYGMPLVQVDLNGERKVWLTLDTGNAGGLLLERSIAAKHKWLTRYATRHGRGRGANSSGEMEAFNLPLLSFGPFELENTLVAVPATNKPIEIFKKQTVTGSQLQRSKSKSRGLLGYDVLKHFVLTIDYKTGSVHVGEPTGEG